MLELAIAGGGISSYFQRAISRPAGRPPLPARDRPAKAGKAYSYPQRAPMMQWRALGGLAALRAVRGRIFDLDGRPLRSAKPRFFESRCAATGLYEPAALRPFMRAAKSVEHFK